MQPLSNKIALVTGGSRGIGAAIAKKLAAQGANVIITYSASPEHAEKVVKDIIALGVKGKAIKADANQPENMTTLAAEALKEFGGIDILVNNAGVWSMGVIGEIDAAEYSRVSKVNIDSVFALTNALVPSLKAGARIINISSGLGQKAAMPGLSAYVASKFAVVGLTRSWAQDLGAKGILVNAVLPGPINTDMNPDTGEFADQARKSIPLGRYGKPEEIAGAVAFLAGPDATFITGATLNVDGGWIA